MIANTTICMQHNIRGEQEEEEQTHLVSPVAAALLCTTFFVHVLQAYIYILFVVYVHIPSSTLFLLFTYLTCVRSFVRLFVLVVVVVC